MRPLTTFDDLILTALEKGEQALGRLDYEQARYCLERACRLYSQHPTGNPTIENRKENLYRDLFLR